MDLPGLQILRFHVARQVSLVILMLYRTFESGLKQLLRQEHQIVSSICSTIRMAVILDEASK